MTITRADLITQTAKKEVLYSDFSTNFQKHPLTNSLIVLKNEDSIKQAFKSLLLTGLGERLFNPNFGSNVSKALFEPYVPFMIDDLKSYINLAAGIFEPRIKILGIQVIDDLDRNGFSINITFFCINTTTPITLNLFLKRVR